ncbi:MAG: uridine kinase [Lactobacillaceae bacterium]|jgi:uridine kinase|nr:uridine kinase [Lactobacillaceae bacterium]
MNNVILIGIAGGSGSGKTSIANKLSEDLKESSLFVISEDAYYKNQDSIPMEQRLKTNYDHPDSIEIDRVISDLKSLKMGKSIQLPVYDYVNHTRSSESLTIEPTQVVIIEGVLLFVDPRVRDLLDIKIFVDTDDDIRFIRRLKRDIAERGRTADNVIEQYLDTVKPMYHQFVEPTKRYANVIIPEGVGNATGVEMIQSRIERILQDNKK